MISVDKLKFDANGLIPAVVVDHYSKKVLTVAYMNRESLAISMEKGLTCFYSRSRKELWLKGETSGNYQHIVAITADCDFDALVVEVVKDGPACHLGTDSCFNNLVWASDSLKEFSLDALYDLIAGRRGNLPRTRKATCYRQEGEAGNNEVKPRCSANNFVRAAPANSHVRQVRSCLLGAVLSRSSSEYRGFTRFFHFFPMTNRVSALSKPRCLA